MNRLEQWFANPDEVLQFASVLIDAGEFDTPRALLDYIEKPWKWDPEHFQWTELSRPEVGPSLMWEKFVRGLAAR